MTVNDSIADTRQETERDIVLGYSKYLRRKVLFTVLCFLIMILAAGYDLSIGDYTIGMIEVYRSVIERLLNWDIEMTMDMGVVWEHRMPRILTAVIAGSGLAVGGAAIQSILKNPLAEPYTMGISAGASFGVTIAVLTGFTLFGVNAGIITTAFIFAMVPTMFILFLSKVKRTSPAMMILAGIAIMYIFNSLSSYLMIRADPNAMAAVYQWTIGTLNRSDWETLPLMFIIVLTGSLVIASLSRSMNAINSGDAYANSIGIDADRMKMIIMVLISLVAAAIVSFTGTIAFIGLVAPHIARIAVGSDNRFLIPASAMFGATLLLISDIIAHVWGGTGMPVGMVTAFVGGPLFIILILKQRRGVW